MNQGKYVFSQIMGLIPYKQFQTIVNRHLGDYKVRDFSCWKQFLCMGFGQLTHRESIPSQKRLSKRTFRFVAAGKETTQRLKEIRNVFQETLLGKGFLLAYFALKK